MALGAQSVFVGSGIFLSADPARRARAIVEAVTHWEDAERLARVSEGLGAAMHGIEISTLARMTAISSTPSTTMSSNANSLDCRPASTGWMARLALPRQMASIPSSSSTKTRVPV